MGAVHMRRFLRWQRAAVQVGYDAGCWAVALVFATLLRYDFNVSRVNVGRLVLALPLAVGTGVLVAFLFRLYQRRWPYGSLEEVTALLRSTITATVVLFVVNALIEPHLVPRSTPVSAGITGVLLMAGGRYAWRLRDERRRRPSSDVCQRVLVFGAGEGATQIVRAMLRNPEGRYLPVALIDDDPAKRHMRIMGVPVVGTRVALADAVRDHDVDALLIAIPSAPAALIADLSDLAVSRGIPVKVLPPVSELLGGRVGVGDIRDVTAVDLLGRHEIRTDLESIAGYLTGKRVLVTGAGGSIGAELCRQIYRFAPSQLLMLDRDESALHAVDLSIYGRATMESPDLVLLDLRDRHATQRCIETRRPEVIFHAAALKHLPLLERHPGEAVKTNVWATLDLLEIAAAAGVERFVNISTDKAADPCSVLGFSKRITERLTSHVARESSTVCLSVRFGNVLGSRGSVLTTFQAQIDRGGPVTVTHPEVTRYFMTVEEAVELVIQAGAIGGDGEALVLDMGKPVRIADLAQLLAKRSERRVTIQYTGLRVGEKLHEVLLGETEADRRPAHPLISHVDVEPLPPEAVRTIDVTASDRHIIARLAHLCGEPAPVESAED